MSNSFTVETRPFEDEGEEDASRLLDYFYSGTFYDFGFSDIVYVARRYDDTPDEATFLGWHPKGGQQPRPFDDVPTGDSDFANAVSYLREHSIGKVSVLTKSGLKQAT